MGQHFVFITYRYALVASLILKKHEVVKLFCARIIPKNISYINNEVRAVTGQ